MRIREYCPEDCQEITELFYETIHTVNTRDYSKEQVRAWAPGSADLKAWNQSFQEHYSLVAELDGRIVGFGDMDETGYLDRLFVHKDYQGQGIASALCDLLEQAVSGTVITHASITARPFFERRGYSVVKEQQVEKRGVFLKNYVMKKQNL